MLFAFPHLSDGCGDKLPPGSKIIRGLSDLIYRNAVCGPDSACRPQEFSDEDAEEDIDALMSAHSKAASRRLSGAKSTVLASRDARGGRVGTRVRDLIFDKC